MAMVIADLAEQHARWLNRYGAAPPHTTTWREWEYHTEALVSLVRMSERLEP